MKKIHSLHFAAIAALLLLNGCQTPVVVRETAPSVSRDAEIARILELKNKGVITEAQALQIINAMVVEGTQPAATVAAGTVKPVTPAATPTPKPAAPVAPAPVVAAPAPAPAASVVEAPRLDARYQPTVPLTGRLRSIGSDTMDVLVARWEEIFTKYHPGLKIVHEGRGSSTATPSLVEGQSDFGPMSRAMQDPEVAKFQERFGYAPTQVRVAIDALGLYVHPSNPISQKGITLGQLDAIFSSTRKRGGTEQMTTWGQLGIGGEWANAPINAYGRNKASGTYGFFRDSALSKGEFGAWVQEQAGSAQVVEQVAADKFGIGYSGVGYKIATVALAPILPKEGTEAIEPSEETSLSGAYPLARPLFLITNRNPATPPSDLQREFLTFVLGPLGQEVVKREGLYPLPPKIVAEEIAKLR
jgi:phosphate transport system substrate-binding protein